MIDKEAIMKCVRGIIMAIGDDPDREGLAETPERVANMYEEMFINTFFGGDGFSLGTRQYQ